MTRRRGSVVLTGPLPPPVHGAALVTERMRTAVREARGEVIVIDTNDRGPAWCRAARMLVGLARLALLVASRRRPAIYVGGAGGELLWFQAVVLAVGRLGGGELVFHHHNTGPLRARTPAMALVVRCGGARLLHVVLGEPMREALQQTYPAARRVVVCSNAGHMEPARVMPGPATPPARVVLGHLSNLSRAKGLADVVDAALAARARGSDVELVVAGPATDPDAERLLALAAAELGDRFTWLGAVERHRVETFLVGLDLFLFPSSYDLEAEPLVVLEAARAGVPTLAYDVGCVGGIVDRPGVVLPIGGDFTDAVATAVEAVAPLTDDDRAERRRAVADGFDRRRRAAAERWRELVGLLVDG
ncbi:glycosyltransferase family 4 protein [Nocardioides albidus]|uniref:Glycosyltransferase family 4 protein n=1 Tax=Nocardioides albidus TaxID=1517589 RepID=A0A5C4W9D3_9ACTN|nr:glycosyltransferase family 4 protein [Nocardioides albidus]TNM44125.1 glycosyltransferase family 4 protein [Nocardioides albidus]